MISVIIVTAKCPIASACNNPSVSSDYITETRYLGTAAPSLVFARETYTAYLRRT